MASAQPELQSCAKMFWKTSLDQSSVILPPFTHFFPPLPHINVGYFDDPSSCNTEITFFNIDMGVGGEISPYIPEKLKNMLFPKIFAHDCRLANDKENRLRTKPSYFQQFRYERYQFYLRRFRQDI